MCGLGCGLLYSSVFVCSIKGNLYSCSRIAGSKIKYIYTLLNFLYIARFISKGVVELGLMSPKDAC